MSGIRRSGTIIAIIGLILGAGCNGIGGPIAGGQNVFARGRQLGPRGKVLIYAFVFGTR
jgi:hypothetical protein